MALFKDLTQKIQRNRERRKKKENQREIHRELKRCYRMADSGSKFESVRQWVSEHKLRTVGCLWLSGMAGTIAYNWSRPNMKTSVKVIHARLNAQALTLAALAGAAMVDYYDKKSGGKDKTYEKYLQSEAYAHKD